MNNPSIFKKYKAPKIGAKEIIKGFDVPLGRGRAILDYTNQLLKDYPNDPAGALKDIALNLKRNERHFAVFIIGNHYGLVFKQMKDKEMIEFLATMAEEIDVGTDRIDPVLTYFIEDVTIKMRGEPITKIIKNTLSTTFSEKEKDYILFSFGLLTRI